MLKDKADFGILYKKYRPAKFNIMKVYIKLLLDNMLNFANKLLSNRGKFK